MSSRRVVVAVLGLGAVVVLWLLFAYDPATEGHFPPCLFHMLTGLSCPACGGLRATHALLHGDVAKAYALNPLYVVTSPLVALYLGAEVLAALRVIPRFRVPLGVVWGLLAVLVVYGVLRNV